MFPMFRVCKMTSANSQFQRSRLKNNWSTVACNICKKGAKYGSLTWMAITKWLNHNIIDINPTKNIGGIRVTQFTRIKAEIVHCFYTIKIQGLQQSLYKTQEFATKQCIFRNIMKFIENTIKTY